MTFIGFVDVYVGMNSVIFVCAGLAGIVSHFVSKRLKGEIDVSLFRYIMDHPGASASVVIGLFAAAFAANALGALDDLKVSAAVAAGFTSGWTIDSCKGRRDNADDHQGS